MKNIFIIYNLLFLSFNKTKYSYKIKEFTIFIRDVHRLIFNRKQLSRNLTIIMNLYELEILENKNSSRKVFRAKRKIYS